MGNKEGETNAYILNLMNRIDSLLMNEYELKDRINKRFKFKLRANEVRKKHIDPLIKRHWLIEIRNEKEINYARIGSLKVNPEDTFKDQFEGITPELLDSYLYYLDQTWDDLDYFDIIPEKEYDSYWQEELEKYIKYQEEIKKQEMGKEKMTQEEIDNLLLLF